MTEMLDAVIVGAGPTGLMLANILGAEGLRVLVVERNTATVQEPRAVSIDDESLRTLQSVGLLETAMHDIVPGYGSTYLTSSGRCFLRVRPNEQPYGHPRRNAFRQPILERQLRKGLERYPNVELRFHTTVDDFIQEPQAVEVAVTGVAGRGTVRCRYLVGCDGGRSGIRKRIGATLKGKTQPERWLIVDLEDSPAGPDTLVFCDPRRPCIALPGPDRTRRFEFKLFRHEDEGTMTSPEKVLGLIEGHGAAPGSRVIRSIVYTFHARIADRWSDRRVFLAGDAAHLTPPFAGQGMNSGIRDAHNLGWKLAMVIRGEARPALLATYEMERRRHTSQMIDLALRMGRIMGPPSRMRAAMVQTAFRAAALLPSVREYFAEMKYKPRPGFKAGFLARPGHPLVGKLLPQPKVSAPGCVVGLLDDLLPKGFVLLGVDTFAEEVEQVQGALARRGVHAATAQITLNGPHLSPRIDIVGDPPEQLKAKVPIIFLLRPDRYVAAAFRTEHVEDFLSSPVLDLIGGTDPGGAPTTRAAA